MADRTPDHRSDGTSQGTEAAPGFLAVFEALRARPGRRLQRRLRRMETRVARRRPAGKGNRQRGDLAEPPPVLDLVLDDPTDHAQVRRMLVERCAVDPVWTLPVGPDDGTAPPAPGVEQGEDPAERTGTSVSEIGSTGPPPSGPAGWFLGGRRLRRNPRAHPEPTETVPRALPRPRFEARDSDTDVTTDELYDLIERLVEGGFAWQGSPPDPPRGRRPPTPTALPRLRSLLWLRRCDLTEIRSRASGDRSEKTPEHGRLENSSQAQVAVINGLREARLRNAIAQRDALLDRARQAAHDPDEVEAPQRIELLRARALVYWRRLARGAAETSRWVTRISGKATFGLFDEKVLTPLAFIVSLVVAATPFAFVGLAAQQLNEIVSLLVGLLLAGVYLLTVFFFFLPWRPYLWLNHHRYAMDRSDGEASEQHDQDQGRFGRHRARGVHLLNELHHPERNKGRIGDDDQPRGTRPPGTHRIAVNALLDDLHRAYGAHRRRGRARTGRPVLVYEQRRLDRVGRYLVRLIEDERLRRAFPDPLVLVQIRDRDQEGALVDGRVRAARHDHLPEFDGTDRVPGEVRRWLRERHLSGALGARRTLTLRVEGLTEAARGRSWRAQPTWVLTRPARAGLLTGVGAISTAVLVLVGLVLVPAQVQAIRPCVQEGVHEPQGITRVGRECVGVTFGAFVFNDRLEQVTELIREQNAAVDADDDPYVTIAHIAELSIADPDDPSLSGGQGELLGLAYQQREHNRHRERHQPAIKLLIGNAGENWAHAMVTAEEIVARAENERLGMDRPIAAVGFGHSVVNNSRAIQKVGEAALTMVGTTATFDDVAQFGAREHSEFYFPVAPSNSRIAEQAAHWARHGVPRSVAEGREIGLPGHETAVAIASAQTDAEGGAHEQYGPHLAQEFMAAFVDRGGAVWEGTEDLGSDEYDDQGVLLYQDGHLETDTTYREHLERLCSDEDPPDLLYYAGRSDDFTRFYRDFMRSGGEECNGGGMTILGGDDISKFVSDSEVLIERNSVHHPVFYTPLAPSGPWGVQEGDSGGSDQGFYEDIDDLLRELHADDARGAQAREEPNGEEGEDGAGLPSAERLPSIAHAAVGNDALLVLANALPATGPTEEDPRLPGLRQRLGLVRPAFLATQEDYQEKRDAIHGAVKTSGTFTGVSGYITFDSANDGNWFGGRMVQLVVVGPRVRNDETGEVQRQHVLERCGMRNSTTVEPGRRCLPVGPDEEG
ncbi:ABC transporter substrate-binding protein [Nocardiopsis sp. MG754419]|uniref:ABC transporter substrate-binding protein n=1 Tax=Nocardiopsis sp. MG754419 TaxID=2259865 RepID=UPI001BAAE05B|nr:ABC transporter substrate-binding protein [Nocardiopsis sp. MG754419]MBR8742709.1 ABC transporter substrate-binding protein [Nocardiopsis sp. MG754419]